MLLPPSSILSVLIYLVETFCINTVLAESEDCDWKEPAGTLHPHRHCGERARSLLKQHDCTMHTAGSTALS